MARHTPHEGKVAVVTGGARGLGQAFAERLAADGASVVVADVEPAGETAELIRAAGGEALTIVCDVSAPDSVVALAHAVEERFGRCDILVNNAGLSPNVHFDDVDLTLWRRVLAVNLDGQFLVSKAVVPGMKERRWGRIVNIASNTMGLVIPGFSHYMASKGGVIGFTRGLATDLGEWGITVNALSPGLTRHASTEAMWEGTDMFESMAQMQAINRPEVPSDLVGTVSFLASEDAGFITGQTLVVDGGLVRL